MSQSEEIKSKLDIVEVIREYIPVKAVGANFQALCPFHNEKTPSFVISPDKQIWHCFGCGRGGDVFSFVMEKEGLGFMEALRLLAPKAGVVLKNENPESYSKRNRLLDIMELAGKYYAHVLTLPAGKSAKDYLLKRGLTEETISFWQIGYSQDFWDGLIRFLKTRPLSGKKYSDEEIAAAGLAIKRDSSFKNTVGRSGYYDRFRGRIMFPIHDVNNNLIAFTARVSPEKEALEKMGKYINSPQSDIYDKSRVLFGLNKAKSIIRKEDAVIVVEGQMDVIACYQHGFENVVASSGTALTSEQVSLLKRFTNNILLLFDMDNAGQMAADRGIKECLAQEVNLKIITLLSGKDPDECLKNSPEDFRKSVAAAKPMLEYYFNKVKAGLELDSAENRRLIEEKMLLILADVSNHTERSFWLSKLNQEIGTDEKELREKLEVLIAKKKSGAATSKIENRLAENFRPTIAKISREEKLVELFLALLMKFPGLISYGSSNFEPQYIANSDLSRFYNLLIIHYNKSTSFNYDSFRLDLEKAGIDVGLADKLILLGEKDFYAHEPEQARLEMMNIISELKKYIRQKMIRKLQQAIAVAEKDGRRDDLDKLMSDLNILMSQKI